MFKEDSLSRYMLTFVLILGAGGLMLWYALAVEKGRDGTSGVAGVILILVGIIGCLGPLLDWLEQRKLIRDFERELQRH